MEKPMSTAIDYNSLENKEIEYRVRRYYPEVRNILEKTYDYRNTYKNAKVGLCNDIIHYSKIYKELEYPTDLWREVIKPWFTPQRFNLEHVYFAYSTPYLEDNKDGCFSIGNQVWLRVPLDKLHPYMLQTAFWFPTVKEYNALRLKVLEYALEDLERIHNKEDIPLPPITFDEPIVY